jgi:putative transposase
MQKYPGSVRQVRHSRNFNSDQGFWFTAHDFANRLEQAKIRISMDGRDRASDNIFVARLWRAVLRYPKPALYLPRF